MGGIFEECVVQRGRFAAHLVIGLVGGLEVFSPHRQLKPRQNGR